MRKVWKEIDKYVYFITVILIIVIVITVAVWPDVFAGWIDTIYNVVIKKFGWLYVFMNLCCFALFFYIIFGRYGNIKLGSDKEKPRFSTFSWAAMIFASGAGSSVIILGFAEPVYYLTNTPFHIEPMSEEAFEYAHMYGQFHWGLSAWAFYVPAIVALCYMLYKRESRDIKFSNALVPLLGSRFPKSPLGKLIDIIVAFGIVASITTSLGLAVPVMGKLISSATGIAESIYMDIFVFAVWFFIFGWSVFRGLDRGIRQLTNVNMALIFGFLAIFILCTPIGEIFGMEINSLGLYMSQLPRIMCYTDPFGDKAFLNEWTIFYWAWWLTFVPIMGMFIAKVSRGRTLKQVIIGQMVWGTLGCCTFLGILGGYSLYLQKNGIVNLVNILQTEGNEGVVLAILDTLPFSKPIIVFVIVLCFVFLATTIDSTALVLGTATSDKLDPDQDPHLYNRFSWAIMIFALSIALSMTGGLNLIQKFAIVLGFPMIFVVILISMSALKAMREDNKNKHGTETQEEH